jgi:hypothetical protein
VLRTAPNGPLLLGATALLRNDEITRADAAAVVLRLLGGNERVVWYHATFDDLPVHEAPGDPLLPRWLTPMLVLLAGAALGLIAWRGRRLGPLSVEPLPVQVRAVEATQSRGRLYRRVRDQEHAASALRDGTLARLSARLGLPHAAPVDAVVAVLSARTGRPNGELRELLADRPVTDDRELVALAAELTELEEELRVDGTEDGRG